MKKNIPFIFLILQFASFGIGQKSNPKPFVQSSFMEWTNIFENLSKSKSTPKPLEKPEEEVEDVSPEKRQGQSENFPLRNDGHTIFENPTFYIEDQTFSDPMQINNPFNHPYFMPSPPPLPWHQSHNFLRFNPTFESLESPNSFFWISEDSGTEKLGDDEKKVSIERSPQSLQHEKDCKEISENLPRLPRLPGNRCYFEDVFKSGICVQSSCLEVRLCRARGRKIMGKCYGVDELCCL